MEDLSRILGEIGELLKRWMDKRKDLIIDVGVRCTSRHKSWTGITLS